MKSFDRRSFLKFSGISLGIGTLYQVLPASAKELAPLLDGMGKANGEAISPFSFLQLSDTHVGFSGPPNPTGTAAFEKAVELINGMKQAPELVLFTGDLTHDTEDAAQHAARMRQFQEIAGRLRAGKVKCVPGEHDAGLDGGELFRNTFGETHYSFDHRGLHFIALDNVSRSRPEVGTEQIEWLKRDLARFPKTAPIVVFTHRPLFDLKPEWEWFTADGDDVMNALAPYENVTVLYGHIHTHDEHHIEHAAHYGARSLAFAFPDASQPEKKPLPFDKDSPFKNLGVRAVADAVDGKAPRVHHALSVREVDLTLREFAGINGIQQMLKEPSY